jgi:F-type H+-transporting ATPase subunit epsilon
MNLQVCIMTPDEIFWNEQAEEIILPTNTGQMGVLTNHAPIITALDIGVMSIRTNKDWTSVALMGALLVKQNQVTVLVNSAESKDKVDAGKAEQAFLEAQEQLDKAVGQKKGRSELCV